MNEQWYKTNFSKDIYVKGKRTSFLRIENIVDDDLWVCAIPIPIDNDDPGTDPFSVNLEKSKTLYDFLTVGSPPKIEEDSSLFNLIGHPDDSGLDGFKFATDLSVWRQLKINEKTDFRIDYNAVKDGILKIVFLFSNINPTNFSSALPRITTNSYPSPARVGDVVRTTGAPNTFETYTGSAWVSIAYPELGIKNIHTVANTSSEHLLYQTTNRFDYQEVYVFGYEQDSNEFKNNLGSALNAEIHNRPIFEDSHSFMLMRTNPKLSGNIKLTVDSSNKIWLNSIDANDELSDSKFKKYKISPSSAYPADLKRFLNDGDVPSEILFQLNEDSYENTKKELKDQFNFFYGYGVQQLKSGAYDEEFSFFAPLWLRKEIPDFFVIFKVPHSLNIETYNDFTKKDIIKNYLTDSQLIKSFDLRNGTKIGTYLRNITESSRFKELPLTVNYEKNEFTTWSGVDYKKGIYSDKVKFLYDDFIEDKTIKEFESIITSGFEKNNLICANLMNLEFLFDDEESDDYSINRYIGFYVNEIELASFKLNKKALTVIDGQTPDPIVGKDGEEYSMQPFIQTNDNGIIFPVDYYQGYGDGIISGKLPLPEHVNDSERFFVLKNRDNDLLRVRSLNEFEHSFEGSSTYQKFTGLELYENELDLSRFLGITKLSYQIPSKLLNESPSQLVFSLTDTILAGETLKISWISINEKFIWELRANPNGLNRGEWWDYPIYDPSDGTYKNTFSNEGTLIEIATAIAGAFNEFENRKFSAVAIEGQVYIISNEKTDNANSLLFERFAVIDSYVNIFKFFEKTATCTYEFFERENTCGASFSYGESCPLQISEYTINFIHYNLGSPGSGLVFVKAVDNRNTLLFEQYVEIGQDISIDALTIHTDTLTSSGVLEIGIKDVVQSQQFVGGTSTKHNVARILKSDIVNVKNDDWFQTKRGTFRTLKNFEIQGEDLNFLFYIDEPIYEADKLVGFNNIDKYLSIYIEDIDNFLIGTNKKLIAYKTYDSKLSLLSFAKIKDFDFDFFKSDYSYFPVGELIRFFEDERNGYVLINPDDEIEINKNEFFILNSGSSATLKLYGLNDTWEEIKDISYNHLVGLVPQFNTLNKNVEFLDTDSSLLYPRSFEFAENTYSKFKIKLITGSNVNITKTLFWQDPDLNNFKGFTGLRDFFGINDELILEKLKENRDFERFLFKLLKSEYDRLGENFLKEFAFDSKVVPFINKWTNQGTDIRDNKYRLTLSSAFGYTNFSPDYTASKPDPTSLTHEWSYLDEIPTGLGEDFINKSRSYFFEDLNTSPITDTTDDNFGKTWYDLLKQNDNDWFQKYFVIGYPSIEYNGNNVIKGTEERFSFIKYNEIVDESYVIFRGVKLKIDDLDKNSKTKIKNSSRYNNYKFSVITRKLNKSLYSTTKPFEIEIIDNRTYKYLLIIISIYFEDYKTLKNIDFTSLYSTKSAFRHIQLFDGSVPTLNYESDIWTNYFANEKARHFGNFSGAPLLDYSDINTYSNVNLLSTNTYLEDGFNTKIQIDRDLANSYGINLELEIKNIQGQITNDLNKDKTDRLLMSFNSFNPIQNYLYQLTPAFFEDFNISSFSVNGDNWPSVIINKKPINSVRGFTSLLNTNIVSDNTNFFIHLRNESSSESTLFYNFGDSEFEPNPLTEFSTFLPVSSTVAETFYLNGGEKYNEQILDKLAFSNIVKEINNDNVNYFEIGDNVEPLLERNFKLNFILYDKIIKTKIKGIEFDVDKPSEFKDTDKIGFTINESTSSDVIYRHRGSFEPKTRNVIDFWVREDESLSSHFNKDFLLCNTKFLTEDENVATILNLFFNKIADNEILKISRTSSYKSEYPLIDEVSIDKRDFFTFSSNWDNDYFQKYTNRSSFDYQEGVREMQEQKSFFGSKVMNVPKVYDIQKFNSDEVTYIVNELDNDALEIKGLLNDKTIENYPLTDDGSKPTLEITVNTKDRLVRYMMENGASNEFKWIKDNEVSYIKDLNDTEVENLTIQYLETNIIELFQVDEVILYVLENVDESVYPILDFTLAEDEKIALGYRKDKNFKIKNLNELDYKITKVIDSKTYNSYSIGVVLKRI